MGRKTATTSAASLVLVALVCIPASFAAAPATADDPVRILIIGDSMTQGSAGDWTWRYRLSKHLTNHGASFDLVGHRDDLYDNVAGVWGSHAYVDPAFDQVHSARWGMELADLEVPISTLVSTYHPDVVLAMLGDNDLSAGTTPTQVGALLEDFVDDARAAQPGIDVVLGHDPRPHTQPNAPALNTEIDARAAALDTPSERVLVANTDAGYDDLQDTWDGAHPNARGELKIAAAFENALHQANGAFPVADPIPTVPLGPRIPPVLTATAQLRAVKLDWVRSPGSQTSEIWQRDLTAGEAWHRVPPDSSALTSTVTGMTDWHQVQFQTKPYKGFWIAQPDAWSNVVQVQVLGDHLDRPAPSATATAGGVATVAWAPVSSAASYAVQWRRTGHPGGWLGSVISTGASATVGGLTNRVGYAFRVRAENGTLAGDWSDETTVVVPSLAAVTRARLRRAHSGQLKATARDVALATSYILLAAPAASCGHPPKSRAFHVVAAGLSRPAKRFRLDARAVWARWIAVRGGVEGDLGPSSTDCLRLR